MFLNLIHVLVPHLKSLSIEHPMALITLLIDQLEGKPFYHIDNKPYCEEGYLVTYFIYYNIINIIIILFNITYL